MDCTGYDRYPVFITRTQRGFQKRKPFEEIKPAACTPLEAAAVPPSDLNCFHSPRMEAVRVIAWFWESFARTLPEKYALQSPSHWLEHFLFRPGALLPLRQAVLAVSVVRWSRTTQRRDVLDFGRKVYTQSLQSMQKLIIDKSAASHDDALAATCVMAMYELFDPTGVEMDGWLKHLDGVRRLLEFRGPQKHSSAPARAVFEHSRYLLMFKHLISRKACILSQHEWLTMPWQDCEKSTEQKVFDNGLRLAAAFEASDNLIITGSSPNHVLILLKECIAVYDAVSLLLEQITPSIAIDLEPGPGSFDEGLIARNPAALMLSITALAIQLGAGDTACGILDVARTSAYLLPINTTSRLLSIRDENRVIAEQIVDSVTTSVNQKVGAMGAARMVFALNLALHQFEQGSVQYADCRQLINQIQGLHDLDDQSATLDSQDMKKYDAVAGLSLVRGNAVAIARKWQGYADEWRDRAKRWQPQDLRQLVYI